MSKDGEKTAFSIKKGAILTPLESSERKRGRQLGSAVEQKKKGEKTLSAKVEVRVCAKGYFGSIT